MYVVDHIAYAGTSAADMKVQAVKPLDDLMMVITFMSGEKRLFDATQLLDMPAFEPLRDEHVFKNAAVDHGVVIWNDGDIDIAPETMYQCSLAYENPQS